MPTMNRDGVELYYEEAGEGDPIVLVHCWAGSGEFMAPQFEHLRRRHRVLNIDLRGHGRSGRPEQSYSIAGFADDMAWMCGELGVRGAALVGHSMGGSIVMDVAARYPALARSVLILEGLVVSPPPVVEAFRPAYEGICSPAYVQVLRGFMDQLFGPHFEPSAKARYIDKMAEENVQYVLASALGDILVYDSGATAAQIKVPVLYVSSGPWYTDVARFRELCPQLVTSQCVGCGHYFELETPEQLNPMIDRFLEVYTKA